MIDPFGDILRNIQGQPSKSNGTQGPTNPQQGGISGMGEGDGGFGAWAFKQYQQYKQGIGQRNDSALNTLWNPGKAQGMADWIGAFGSKDALGGMSFDDWQRANEQQLRDGWAIEAKNMERQRLMDDDAAKARERQVLIDAFTKEMMTPLDRNDPRVQRVIMSAGGQANQAMANRGIEGGAATGAVARAEKDSERAFQDNRYELGLRGAQLGTESAFRNSRAAVGDFRYDTGLQAADAKQKWDWELGQKQGIQGIAGGVIGSIIGGKFGGQQGAQLGAQGGSQLGMGSASLGFRPPPLSSGMTRDSSGGY